MPATRVELLKGKATEATEYDKLVLALLRRRPSRTTAVQKVGLLVHAVYTGEVPKGFNPHFFGGFNDDIDQSLEELQEGGFVYAGPDDALALTPSGEELVSDYLTDPDSTKVKDVADRIVPRMARLTDSEILAVMYELFPELTTNSLIKNRVQRVHRVRNIEIATIPH